MRILQKVKYVFALLFIALSLLSSCQTALAEAGDPGGVKGGSCVPDGYTGNYWDTCYGAAWKYFYTTEDVVEIPSRGNTTGGTITGCGKYGGYYRLGLVKFKAVDGKAVSSTDELIGFQQNYKLKPFGGGVTFRAGDSDESLETLAQKFAVAKADDKTNGFEWNEVSWFCYDKAWDNTDAHFASKSTVSAEGQTATSDFDGEADLEINTNSDSVTATFHHQLFFEQPNTFPEGATVADVTANWNVIGVGNGAWTTNGAKSAESPTLAEKTVEIPVGIGEEKTVCYTISYSPKTITFKEDPINNFIIEKTEGSEDSRACITVKRGGASEGSGDGEFWSTTTLKVDSQSPDVSNHSYTTEKDGYVDLRLSTDRESLTVKFSHNLYYTNHSLTHSGDPLAESHDVFPTVSTDWNVVQGSDSGTFSVSDPAHDSTNSVDEETVTISLAKGETKKVCRKLAYKQYKFYSFSTSSPTHCHRWCSSRNGSWCCGGYYTYKVASISSRSGQGASEACITVTRPEDPSKTGPNNPSGTNGGDVLYAGEDVTIQWDTEAPTSAVRRLDKYRSVVYLWPVNTPGNNNLVTGIERTTRGPSDLDAALCNHYSGKYTVVACDPALNYGNRPNSATLNYGVISTKHTYNGSETLMVPDYVGYKYCNTAGYHYQYWYYVSGAVGASSGWQRESQYDYWYIYGASCRTIAKKPSLAVWNANFFSNGGVTTSTSNRHKSAAFATRSNSDRIVYGSWDEHLNVINGGVRGFGSGASFATGSDSTSDLYNSPLTIANNAGSVGGSGVSTNSALLARLNTYMKNGAGVINNNIGGSGYQNLGSGDTRIVRYAGDLTISGNITLSDSTLYDSIYRVPQVVIFVDGNVHINSNVTRIDAWIIATGNINTCVNFAAGSTEADAVGRYNDTCTNQLVFNGPVIAQTLTLNRSYGSDPLINRQNAFYNGTSQKQSPGEIFNFRADNYLWAYAQAGRYASSYTEAYTRELAPRY